VTGGVILDMLLLRCRYSVDTVKVPVKRDGTIVEEAVQYVNRPDRTPMEKKEDHEY